ncbi:GAF domain-containing protein [uncultured Williamsia sp.]|uniref:GAF domain-containing protein n=1 Tax=uncultured Williamsia sp. TaxID=259311 RepID=UPI002609088C|nr:GAF domain-containing protein [uncultured Williamsia sp.]
MAEQPTTSRTALEATQPEAIDAGDSWLLIETMGTGTPTVVFDTDKPKRFTSISRRQRFTDSTITVGLVGIVDEVRRDGQPAHRRFATNTNDTLSLFAAPILGPDSVVFAVQVLITGTDDPGAFLAGRRKCGAFVWDPTDQVTYHGPTMESEIMGVDESVPHAQRVSPEVFSLFDEFPRINELGAWTSEVLADEVEDDSTFYSDLLMTGVDGVQRSAFMTFKAVRPAPGERSIMRGLVHDVTDIRPPMPAAGFNAALVRSAFGMTEAPTDAGIGHLNFPTRIILEWFHAPPAPLDRWTRENAEIHPDDRSVLDKNVDELAAGAVDEVTFDLRVRFADTDWIPTQANVRAALPGDLGQGLVKITPLT